MRSRRHMLKLAAMAPALALAPSCATPPTTTTLRNEALATMRRATSYMLDTVAVNGGYVWSYLADFSRRWGEMEAYPSMIWTQAPGTPEMGQLFLDAYRATGEECYYDAAASAADGLIAGQHPSGGWNYVIDFAGEDSIRRWYETIGANGWRLEEFQHYYGNATFDDAASIECGRLLLRMYLEKREERFRAPLEKSIGFVVNSQYPSGGWPQRWPPPAEPFQNHGRPDYTGYITLNDEVAENNIAFLLLAMQQLQRNALREPIRRAMELYPRLQQAAPTPGWALQYTTDLDPAGARTYEPRAVTPHTTAAAIEQLMFFYTLTGERKFLTPIPSALEWLEEMEATPEALSSDGRNFFRYVEVGTNRFLAVRRRGSNAQNGAYYVNYDMTGERGQRRVDLSALRSRYEELAATPPERATANSVWFGRGPSLMPHYVITRDLVGADLAMPENSGRANSNVRVRGLIDTLNSEGYWPTRLESTSHTYRGRGAAEPSPGFIDNGQVGDAWDTSPFSIEDGPIGISTSVFIRNMSQLIEYVAITAHDAWRSQ